MSGGVGSVGVVAKEAREVLAVLAAADLTGLADGEVTELVVLAGEVVKLADAVLVQAVSRLDVLRAWEDGGARSASTWVSWQCGLSKGRAAGLLSCARLLRVLPGTHAAFLAGELTVEHVRLLGRAQRACPEAFATDEAKLVRLAGEMLFRRWEIGIRYWIDVHAPDDAESDAAERFESRRLDHSKILDGMVVLDALLDPMTGAIVTRELERLEKELFEHDWAHRARQARQALQACVEAHRASGARTRNHGEGRSRSGGAIASHLRQTAARESLAVPIAERRMPSSSTQEPAPQAATPNGKAWLTPSTCRHSLHAQMPDTSRSGCCSCWEAQRLASASDRSHRGLKSQASHDTKYEPALPRCTWAT